MTLSIKTLGILTLSIINNGNYGTSIMTHKVVINYMEKQGIFYFSLVHIGAMTLSVKILGIMTLNLMMMAQKQSAIWHAK
jgi:hypothetical protein